MSLEFITRVYASELIQFTRFENGKMCTYGYSIGYDKYGEEINRSEPRLLGSISWSNRSDFTYEDYRSIINGTYKSPVNFVNKYFNPIVSACGIFAIFLGTQPWVRPENYFIDYISIAFGLICFFIIYIRNRVSNNE